MGISAKQVQALRQKTNVGMMDCKRALEEANGDTEKAVEILRTRGIAKSEDRMGRVAREGVITSYIHTGNKLGVMVEVNSETDFVARTDEFQAFARDLAMHIAASAPLAVSRDDLKPDLVERECAIYKEQALREGKPEGVVDRIVEGRLEKYFEDACLLEQPFVKDPEKTIKDLLMELIAKCGENVTVRRFTRFVLGEES
jgi:elongation factor Ts